MGHPAAAARQTHRALGRVRDGTAHRRHRRRPPAPDEKLRLLGLERTALEDPGAHHDDPVIRALDDAARRLPIPLTAFGELIDGCEMDIAGRSYETIDDLVDYCRCVAGSIGRLSLGVFDPRVDPLALHTASAQADAWGSRCS